MENVKIFFKDISIEETMLFLHAFHYGYPGIIINGELNELFEDEQAWFAFTIWNSYEDIKKNRSW